MIKQKYILVIIALFTGFNSKGQTMTDYVLKEARSLLAQYKDAEALAKYKQVLGYDMNNYEALWNCSILSSRTGKRETDKAKQKELYSTAKSYAERALKVNSEDAQSNYVMAVAMGRIAQTSGTQEKVAAVREIKKYAEKALSLNPKHAPSNHVLAIWNLEVSELGWVERQVADKFYGGLPDASKEKALEYCKKATEYEPNYILYQFDLGRIYKIMGDKKNAKEAFTKVGNMKALTPDDPNSQAEAKKILETL
jgi:tetratricopeptide (TPR) repeat protein